METRVRVEYIDYRGSKRQKTISKHLPDFKEKTINKILTHKLKSSVTISVEQQILEYLDDISFGKEFMAMCDDCYIVVNYWVANKKRVKDEQEEIKKFVDKYIKDPQLKIDFIAIYAHMGKNLKGLAMDKKLHICLSALIATYKSASEAYNNITNYYDKTKSLENGTK